MSQRLNRQKDRCVIVKAGLLYASQWRHIKRVSTINDKGEKWVVGQFNVGTFEGQNQDWFTVELEAEMSRPVILVL